MASILYFGTDEGVVALRSENGRSWKVESHTLKEWSIPEVTVAASQPNRVFAGTRGDGVWVSEDFGKSWKKPCYGKPGPGKVRCLTFDSAGLLYAGGEPIELFVSDDSAKSWKRLDSVRQVPWVSKIDYPVPTVEPHIRDIAIDPKNPKKIYVALQVGYMLKSTDGGSSWKVLDKELDADVHTIVIHPRDTSTLFIATGGHDCRLGRVKGKALYVSRDEGETWSPIATDFSQEYSVPLTLHPKDPNTLYSTVAHGQPSQWRRPTGAEALIIRSRDGGKKWERLDGKLAEMGKNFAETIAIDGQDPQRLYAGLRNGELYASEDAGESWAKLDVKLPSIGSMTWAQV